MKQRTDVDPEEQLRMGKEDLSESLEDRFPFSAHLYSINEWQAYAVK